MDTEPNLFQISDFKEIEKFFSAKNCGLYFVGLISKVFSTQRREIFLIKLNIEVNKYLITKEYSKDPTQKQVKEECISIYKKVEKLLSSLNELQGDGMYLFSAIMSAKAGCIATYEIGDKLHENLGNEIYTELDQLMKGLTWLEANLKPCTQENYEYPSAIENQGRKKPETFLIQNISSILSEYFKVENNTGYSRGVYNDQNSASGWRIDCLAYLLNCIKIPMRRNQILEAVTSP